MKPLGRRIYEKRKYWQELVWAMANGVKSEYDNIMKTDIMEFWYLFDMWLDRIKQENKRASENAANKKR